MQAMKGATMALGSMNRTMNLPSLQRIAMEFERENDIMEQRQEMMDDAIDDAMDVGLEEEGDEVVEQVLEEIGVDLKQAVGPCFIPPFSCTYTTDVCYFSSEKHPLACSQVQCQNRKLPKPSVAEVAETQVMMTCRHGLIA